MSQALPFLSIGMQAGSAMFEGMSQRNAFKSAAATDKENARLSILDGALKVEDIRRRGRATQGEAISALADGGGGIGGTSAQDLIFQNALEIEYATLNTKFSASQEARGHLARAAQNKAAGRAAMIGGIMRAGAAAISGASNMMNQGKADAAFQQRYQSYFPGGQQMPMPTGGYSPPPYRGNGGF